MSTFSSLTSASSNGTPPIVGKPVATNFAIMPSTAIVEDFDLEGGTFSESTDIRGEVHIVNNSAKKLFLYFSNVPVAEPSWDAFNHIVPANSIAILPAMGRYCAMRQESPISVSESINVTALSTRYGQFAGV